MSTRRNNVIKYMNEWRDGSWYMKAPESLANRVADEVIAYTDLQDSTANYRAYELTTADMLADKTLIIVDHGNGFITLEVA